jgi:flagellin
MTHSQGADITIQTYNNSNATKTATLAGAQGASITLTGAAATDSAEIGGVVTFNSPGAFNVSAAANTTLISAAASSTLSAVGSIDISTLKGANSALAVVDGALTAINSSRAALGALQNRFQMTINNLNVTSENVSQARSRIRDADFAAETANLTRSQILQQAGTAMLSQANALPNQVLQLLK